MKKRVIKSYAMNIEYSQYIKDLAKKEGIPQSRVIERLIRNEIKRAKPP